MPAIVGRPRRHLGVVIMQFCLAYTTSHSTLIMFSRRADQVIDGMDSPSADYNNVTIFLYFVRSGYVNVNISRFGLASSDGYSWSATSSAKRFDELALFSTYYFSIRIADVRSSSGPSSRWYGYPLRGLKSVY